MESPEQVAKPRHGQRAALIRKMKVRYPELTGGEIARQIGCSPQNVNQVLSAFLAGRSEGKLKEFQSAKADIYDAMAMRVLESVTKDKLKKMPAYPAIVSVGILHDKAALLRGQATSFNVNVLMDVAAMIRRDE